jgi:hypothetical protein
MAQQAVFRFPGRGEVWYIDPLPEPGDIVTSAGESWVVMSVESPGKDRWHCTLARVVESERPSNTRQGRWASDTSSGVTDLM